jgi:tRNA (guanine-N7-)-methyltransferase
MAPSLVWTLEAERELRDLPAPLDLETIQPGAGGGEWEVEIGFGKGRYLLARAAQDPDHRFLGMEVASQYYRLSRDRAARRGLANLVLLRGDAMFLMSAVLPTEWASAVHVYFPDPWPKDRHHKRRLFDPESVDLVLGLLRPGGRLYFATDFLEYGALVRHLLAGHPAVELAEHDSPWPDGLRTNYEAKFAAEGRPIIRLTVTRRPRFGGLLLHPGGRDGVVAAPRTGSRPVA